MGDLDSGRPANSDRLALGKILGIIQAFECGCQDELSCQATIKAVQRIAVLALDKPTTRADCWHGWPDSEHINALPQPIRQYIHDLETHAAGNVVEIASLVAEIASLKETIKALKARLESC